MKPRAKKILIVYSTAFFIGLNYFYAINYDFFYLQRHDQNLKAQDMFWESDVTESDFRSINNAYNAYFVDGSNSFSLSLNEQYEATYNNKIGRDSDPDVFSITLYKKATDGNKRKQVKSVVVYRNNFKIANMENIDTISTDELSPEGRRQLEEMTDNSLSQEEIDDLTNLAIKRFKEAQDKYYSNKIFSTQ